MNAGDVMSRNLVAVRGDATLLSVLRLMIDNCISGVPVLGANGQVAGILTEGDLLRRSELGTDGRKPGPIRAFFAPDRLAGDYVHTHGRRACELMTTNVTTVTETTPLEEIAERMRKHRIKRLPVTRNSVCVGIVSRADLVRALFRALDVPAMSLDDDAIKDAVIKELDQRNFLLHRAITVTVSDTTIALDGLVFDIRQRDAAQVVAENFSGTKSVENRLVVVDPGSGTIELDPAQDEVMATPCAF